MVLPRQEAVLLDRPVTVDPPATPPRQGPRRAIDRAGELLLEAPLGVVLTALAVVAVLKDGVSPSSNLAYWLRIARAFPGPPHLVARSDYMLSSPIGPAVAHVLGLETITGYVLLHLVAVMIGLALMVAGLLRRGGHRAAVLGCLLFVASPLSDVLLSWLGMQDAWLFAAFCVLALYERPVALAAAAAVAGLAHPEMAAIVVTTMSAVRWIEGRDGRGRHQVVAMAIGLAAGCAGTVLYELNASGSILGDGSFIAIIGLGTIAGDFLRSAPAWLWSAFGGGWAWVAGMTRRARPRSAVVVSAAAVAVAVAMSVITLDETRVFVLLTFPLVLWWAVRSVQVLPAARLRAVAVLVLVCAVAVPDIVVHAGHVTG